MRGQGLVYAGVLCMFGAARQLNSCTVVASQPWVESGMGLVAFKAASSPAATGQHATLLFVKLC